MTTNDLNGWIDHYGAWAEILLGSIAILIAGGAIILAVNRALQRLLLRLPSRIHLPPETVLTLGRVISALLAVVVGFILLAFWGISVSGVWASLVSVAAVIGVGFLAVWTMISNITASLFISVWRPFHLGDTVELVPENLKGRAIDRNLMFTVLREGEQTALFIPNNLFFQKMFRVTATSNQYLFEALERDATPQTRRAYAPAGE